MRINLATLAVLALTPVALSPPASAQDTRVLFVLSAHEHGYWLPEVVTPYKILTDAGLGVDFATPAGDPGVPAGGQYMTDSERKTLATLKSQLAAPIKLKDVDVGRYAALYVPGGAGPMFDLFDHPQVNRIAADMYERGKPVTAACHGPAALAEVRLSNGERLIKGKHVTAKSNAEEGDWARANYPFLLEDKLKETSAQFSAAEPYEPWVVRDGLLITGQNPASAGPLAEALLEALSINVQSETP